MTIKDADKHFSLEGLKINEQCFIRKEHKCDKIMGASKSCFIACPTNDELEPILALMSEKLTKVGIEPIIAVKERAYGQDIFCTKICGKIVESRFCIVILDDALQKKQNIPNPNVYYEYGLMTTMRKHIIPLQKENQKLAFNIQSYDTIKYNAKNIASELERAIRDAIGLTESKSKQNNEHSISDKSVLRAFELTGFELKNENWVLSDALRDTAFKGFGQYEKGFYAFVGKIDEQQDILTYLDDLDVVTYRSEKIFAELSEELKKQKKKFEEFKEAEIKIGSDVHQHTASVLFHDSNEMSPMEKSINSLQVKLDLMKTIYVAFISNLKSELVKGFLEKAKPIINDKKRYKIILSENNELLFGDIRVSLARSK